ncbi:hypothetical protein Tco_0947653 [Tanacetum coccineum]
MRNMINLHTARDDSLLGTPKYTYYAYASGAKEPKKARKFKKPASPKLKTVLVSPKEPTKKPVKGKKDVYQTRKPSTKPKLTKKKAPVKADRGKGLNVLSAVALSKNDQLKEATKQSKKYFHISYASGSGDGTDFESGVPDEQQRKISGIDEGNEDDDDEDDFEDESDDDNNDNDDDNNDDDGDYNDDEDKNDDDDEANSDRTESEKKDNADNAKEENKEEKDDAEELYIDVNVNLREEDIEMTDDDHVLVIPEITSAFTITIPLPPPSFNPLPQQETPTPTATASDVTTSFLALPDLSSVFRFNERVTNLEKDLSEMKQVDRYAQAISSIPAIVDRYIDNKLRKAIQQAIKSHTTECKEEALANKTEYIDLIDTSVRAIIKEESSSQPKFTYEAVASLSEFELTKILMDKMEEHKSYLRADYKRELYDALVKSYNTEKDLFETYGKVFTLKRNRDDKDKDQNPSTRSDRGKKISKSSKDVESSRDPKSKESKSTSSSKGTSSSQHKSSGKSAHAEEPSHTVDDSGRKYSTSITKTKAATYKVQWIEDMVPNLWSPVKVVYDKHAYWGTSHWGPKRQRFYEFSSNWKSKHDVYSRKQIIAVTSLKIMKWYDYGHLEEIEVCREDQ